MLMQSATTLPETKAGQEFRETAKATLIVPAKAEDKFRSHRSHKSAANFSQGW
jgi:hypothetical protein